MATRMHPGRESRVFAAATDRPNLAELKRLELTVLEDGNIGGLNGVLVLGRVLVLRALRLQAQQRAQPAHPVRQPPQAPRRSARPPRM